MARITNKLDKPQQAVETQPAASALPPHLARLVNPRVLAARRDAVRRATTDPYTTEERRKRYLETIVDNHLWEEMKGA